MICVSKEASEVSPGIIAERGKVWIRKSWVSRPSSSSLRFLESA